MRAHRASIQPQGLFVASVRLVGLLLLTQYFAACTGIIAKAGKVPKEAMLTLKDDESTNLLWKTQGVDMGAVVKGNRESLKIRGECADSKSKIIVTINAQKVGSLSCVNQEFVADLQGFTANGVPQLYALTFANENYAFAPISVKYEYFKISKEELLWDLNTGPTSGVLASESTLTAKCHPLAKIFLNDEPVACSDDGTVSQVLALPKFGSNNPNVFALIWRDDYGNGNADAPYLFSIYRNAPGAPHFVADQGGATSPAGMVSYLRGTTVSDSSGGTGLKFTQTAGFATGVGTHNPPPLSVQDAGTGLTITIGR